jgi:hypothetical protein
MLSARSHWGSWKEIRRGENKKQKGKESFVKKDKVLM